MNQCGIEDWKRRIALIEQHSDLRASEDKAIRASLCEPPRDMDKSLPRRFGHAPDAQLIINDLMDKRPVSLIGNNNVQTEFLAQPAGIKILLHREPRRQHGRLPLCSALERLRR